MPAIVVAIVAGFLVGGLWPQAGLHFSLPGRIFLNLLTMIVMPLVVFSLIVGVTNLGNAEKIGPMGKRTITYYMATTALSVVIGLIAVNIIEPGRKAGLAMTAPVEQQAQSGHVPSEHIQTGPQSERPARSLPTVKERNILETFTVMIVGDRESGREGMVPRNVFNALANMDVLPVIFFSILLGLALIAVGEAGRPAIAVARSLNAAVHRMVDWIMVLSPPGIFGIIAERVGAAGGFAGFIPELEAMGLYAGTVISGLLVHGIVVLPAILFFIGKRRPLGYVKGAGVALLNAFSTASSSATLPLSMQAVEFNNGISPRTAGFVLPLGATINMDGTALYEAVAALFIAQAYGIDLSLADQAVVFVTATLAAVGAAGIPEAGLVTMVLVLRAVGLPLEGIGLILAIDWFLDRCRTTINVWGDIVGAGVVETLERIKENNNGLMEDSHGSEKVFSEEEQA